MLCLWPDPFTPLLLTGAHGDDEHSLAADSPLRAAALPAFKVSALLPAKPASPFAAGGRGGGSGAGEGGLMRRMDSDEEGPVVHAW